MSLVILDFCLKGLMGHPYEYDRAVLRAAAAAGWKRSILAAHKQIDPAIQAELKAVPCFSADLDENLVSPLKRQIAKYFGGNLLRRYNMAAYEQSLLRDLEQLPQDAFDLDRPNLVLVPTIRHTQIPGIIRWMELVNRKAHVTCSIVLHFTAFPDFTSESCTAELYELAYRRMERSPIKDRIRLFADSDTLIAEHSRYTRHPIELVPIPHTHDLEAQDGSVSSESGTRLVYRGDARINKGYHLLGGLFSSLRGELAEGKIVGEIQSNLRSNSEALAQCAKNTLKQLPNIVLHDHPLTSDQYAGLLNRADIVLAPYTIDYYHSQTSGVVAEAIAAGKPLIVPRGTWGCREIERYGGGGVSFCPSDGQSLLEATRAAVANLPELKAKAQRVAATYAAFHNYDSFFRIVADGINP